MALSPPPIKQARLSAVADGDGEGALERHLRSPGGTAIPRQLSLPLPCLAPPTPDASSFAVQMSGLRRLSKPELGLNVDYFPAFFKRRDADAIFQRLEAQLEPYFASSKSEVRVMGRLCAIPRKQTAFGDEGLRYKFSGAVVRANPWIPLLRSIKERVEEVTGESFNFVLVNRYKDGRDHIGEHRDDEADLCQGAAIASLSFGQAREFVFRHREARGRRARCKDVHPVKLELEHGSLLMMRHPTNREWYHSLPVRKGASSVRINLTLRRMKTN